MSDSEDDSSNEMDVDNTGKIKARKKRIRQYEKSHKGPFVVYIRIDEHTPLKPIKLTKFIFGTCKSSVVVHQVNANKMRVNFVINSFVTEMNSSSATLLPTVKENSTTLIFKRLH